MSKLFLLITSRVPIMHVWVLMLRFQTAATIPVVQLQVVVIKPEMMEKESGRKYCQKCWALQATPQRFRVVSKVPPPHQGPWKKGPLYLLSNSCPSKSVKKLRSAFSTFIMTRNCSYNKELQENYEHYQINRLRSLWSGGSNQLLQTGPCGWRPSFLVSESSDQVQHQQGATSLLACLWPSARILQLVLGSCLFLGWVSTSRMLLTAFLKGHINGS